MIHNPTRAGSAKSSPGTSKKVPTKERAGSATTKGEDPKRRRLGSHATEYLIVENGRLKKKER
jgi:hypothetical protein